MAKHKCMNTSRERLPIALIEESAQWKKYEIMLF